MKVFLACLLLALGVNCASAYCMVGTPPKVVPYKWSHKMVMYCEYHGMKFMAGSKWIDAERCLECTCAGCCGIGYYAGRINPGDNCTVVADHCDAVFLNKEKTGLCHPK